MPSEVRQIAHRKDYAHGIDQVLYLLMTLSLFFGDMLHYRYNLLYSNVSNSFKIVYVKRV